MRDPVALLIYAVAAVKGVFPLNRFIVLTVALGAISLGISVLVFDRLAIILFGLRTNFCICL